MRAFRTGIPGVRYGRSWRKLTRSVLIVGAVIPAAREAKAAGFHRGASSSCFAQAPGISHMATTALLRADSEHNDRERSSAEFGGPGASHEPGRCKHQSSSRPAGGRAAGIGQTRSRRPRPSGQAESRESPDAGRVRTAPGSRLCVCKPRSSASARQAQHRVALLPLVPPSCPLLVSAASRLGELGYLTSLGALRPYDSGPGFPKKLKEWTPAADTS